MNRHKYIFRVFIAAAIAMITVLYTLEFSEKPTMGLVLANAYGGGLLDKKNTVISLMASILPVFTLCFFMSNYIADNFASGCIYIFTRSRSRVKWIAEKTVNLFLFTAAFYVICLSFALVITVCWGIKINPLSALGFYVVILLFDTLSTFMIILPLNLLSIRVSSVISFLICMGTWLLFLVVGIFASPRLSVLLPFSQGNYVWHQPLWLSQTVKGLNCSIEGFSLTYSLLYMVAIVVIEVCASALIMNKMDLLGGPEGEN